MGGPVKCQYFNCGNTFLNRSMFRFPWHNANRLKIWLHNCGNMTIAHLPKEILRNKYLCVDHFNERYLRNTASRKRLVKEAIPEPFLVRVTETRNRWCSPYTGRTTTAGNKDKMAPIRCNYINCGNTNLTTSMFRFPWKDENNLKIWLENCGNMLLAHLPKEKLRSKYLCVDHFDYKYLRNTDCRGILLEMNAVPFHFRAKDTQTRNRLPSPTPETKNMSKALTTSCAQETDTTVQKQHATKQNHDTTEQIPTATRQKNDITEQNQTETRQNDDTTVETETATRQNQRQVPMVLKRKKKADPMPDPEWGAHRPSRTYTRRAKMTSELILEDFNVDDHPLTSEDPVDNFEVLDPPTGADIDDDSEAFVDNDELFDDAVPSLLGAAAAAAPAPPPPHGWGTSGPAATPERTVHSGFKCNSCLGEIAGFRYRCVQCADYDLCPRCEGRGEHAPHYVLRLPRPAPPAEVRGVLAAVRLALRLPPPDEPPPELPKEVDCKALAVPKTIDAASPQIQMRPIADMIQEPEPTEDPLAPEPEPAYESDPETRADFEEAVEASVADFDEAVEASVADFDEAVEASVADFDEAVEASVADFDEAVEASVADFDEAVEASAADTEDIDPPSDPWNDNDAEQPFPLKIQEQYIKQSDYSNMRGNDLNIALRSDQISDQNVDESEAKKKRRRKTRYFCLNFLLDSEEQNDDVSLKKKKRRKRRKPDFKEQIETRNLEAADCNNVYTLFTDTPARSAAAAPAKVRRVVGRPPSRRPLGEQLRAHRRDARRKLKSELVCQQLLETAFGAASKRWSDLPKKVYKTPNQLKVRLESQTIQTRHPMQPSSALKSESDCEIRSMSELVCQQVEALVPAAVCAGAADSRGREQLKAHVTPMQPSALKSEPQSDCEIRRMSELVCQKVDALERAATCGAVSEPVTGLMRATVPAAFCAGAGDSGGRERLKAHVTPMQPSALKSEPQSDSEIKSMSELVCQQVEAPERAAACGAVSEPVTEVPKKVNKRPNPSTPLKIRLESQTIPCVLKPVRECEVTEQLKVRLPMQLSAVKTELRNDSEIKRMSELVCQQVDAPERAAACGAVSEPVTEAPKKVYKSPNPSTPLKIRLNQCEVKAGDSPPPPAARRAIKTYNNPRRPRRVQPIPYVRLCRLPDSVLRLMRS